MILHMVFMLGLRLKSKGFSSVDVNMLFVR
jgi:hypothetical protein